MKLLSVGISFDLSKVYNGINHQSSSCYDISAVSFLHKPEYLGFRGIRLDWRFGQQQKIILFRKSFLCFSQSMMLGISRWVMVCLNMYVKCVERFQGVDLSDVYKYIHQDLFECNDYDELHCIGRITVLYGFCNSCLISFWWPFLELKYFYLKRFYTFIIPLSKYHNLYLGKI